MSQVLRGSPELRVPQVLAVLAAIGVSPSEFFRGLYGMPSDEARRIAGPAPEGDVQRPSGFDELWRRLGEVIGSQIEGAREHAPSEDSE